MAPSCDQIGSRRLRLFGHQFSSCAGECTNAMRTGALAQLRFAPRFGPAQYLPLPRNTDGISDSNIGSATARADPAQKASAIETLLMTRRPIWPRCRILIHVFPFFASPARFPFYGFLLPSVTHAFRPPTLKFRRLDNATDQGRHFAVFPLQAFDNPVHRLLVVVS